MASIFEYTDYRRFLADAYAERRKENKNFSYRYIAAKSGFASAGFFANVLKGDKHISLKTAMRLAEIFRLNPKERQYFELLILFNKADTHRERQEYLGRMLAMRGAHVTRTAPEQWEFYDKWHYTAVREALALQPFRGNFRALAALIDPPISEKEAMEAVELLMRLGLIFKNAQGVYERADAAISSGDAISEALIERFQQQTMELGRRALDQLPRSRRNFSTLTLSVSKYTYESILAELRSFRRRVLEMASGSEDPDRVLQMNFHVFPLSQVSEEDLP